MSKTDLDQLAADLADFAPQEKKVARSPKEERIIAGFEEIQRFVDEHGHAPRQGEDLDIFERLYAVRLRRLRELSECRELLTPLDRQGLLAGEVTGESVSNGKINLDELADDLKDFTGGSDITELKHVRSTSERQAAEEIAQREKCEDFEKFKPLFKAVQSDLDSGARITRQIRKDAGFLKTDIRKGEFFILGGQVAYVAEVGETFKAPNGENDARLRVIYSNGTESDLLLRSMQRALYKDDTSRRISDPTAGPLFSSEKDDEDLASGTVYVLRSKSEHPMVAANRDIVHKIGVTGGSVEKRIANAEKEATYLLSGVEVVATYQLFNINRTKLENIIHRVFEPARLNIEIKDRFGHPFTPREWFLVPLFVIDEAIEKIKDGTIGEYSYNPVSTQLMERHDAD